MKSVANFTLQNDFYMFPPSNQLNTNHAHLNFLHSNEVDIQMPNGSKPRSMLAQAVSGTQDEYVAII